MYPKIDTFRARKSSEITNEIRKALDDPSVDRDTCVNLATQHPSSVVRAMLTGFGSKARREHPHKDAILSAAIDSLIRRNKKTELIGVFHSILSLSSTEAEFYLQKAADNNLGLTCAVIDDILRYPHDVFGRPVSPENMELLQRLKTTLNNSEKIRSQVRHEIGGVGF